jgi:hypothetical protein
MSKFIIGLFIGIVAGGALAFYLFVGVPRAARVPGELIKTQEAGNAPAGTATIVLRQEFFNEVLTAIFRDMNALAFPLNLTGENRAPNTESFALQPSSGGNCESNIILKPEGSGVQSSVRFENGTINAPLAFAGSYNIPFVGCTNFTGWAQTNLDLKFDAEQKAVFGQVNVQTVNLDGITPLASGVVTPLVQNTLNQRVNPIPILRGEQINLSLPVAAANGKLNAKVQDIRAEVKDNALNLYVIYDFRGTK